MATPPALNHSLLRPVVLHILRAAGYHSTRTSVLDIVTDLAARYMYLLAQSTASHAGLNHTEPELAVEVSVQDVRMAMQDCGLLLPEKTVEEQIHDGFEDTRGIDAFIEWAMGPGNQEIRRVALDGGDMKEDYLTVLKKKHSTTGDEESRYTGTVLGRPAERRNIKIEGSEISTIKEWAEITAHPPKPVSANSSSRRQSSELSTLGDDEMEGLVSETMV